MDAVHKYRGATCLLFINLYAIAGAVALVHPLVQVQVGRFICFSDLLRRTAAVLIYIEIVRGGLNAKLSSID